MSNLSCEASGERRGWPKEGCEDAPSGRRAWHTPEGPSLARGLGQKLLLRVPPATGLPAKYKWLRRGPGIFSSVVFSAKYLVLGIYMYMRILAGRWVSPILYHSSGFQLKAQSSTWSYKMEASRSSRTVMAPVHVDLHRAGGHRRRAA